MQTIALPTMTNRRLIVRVLIAASATIVLGHGAPALAAATQLCIGGPSATATSPNADGKCASGFTLTTLAAADDLKTAEARVYALEKGVYALEKEMSVLKTKLSKVSYSPAGLNGKPTLKIDGANLQIVNGLGATDGDPGNTGTKHVNGLGNLFIGYDAQDASDVQTGSHNLVLGSRQTFTSYAGLLGGFNSSVLAPFSAVITGNGNTASGSISAVLGGSSNTASGPVASVLGGDENTASGDKATVSGGFKNTASGWEDSVSGGWGNTASGHRSSVSGGYNNTASGNSSSVSGGQDNTASGFYSSLLGGYAKTVNATYGTSP